MPDLIIPCLTLWQPHASLMAEGLKRIETRAYPAGRLGLLPGQLVAVHAAKRAMSFEEKLEWSRCPELTGLDVDALPYGAVLSVHRFQMSEPTSAIKRRPVLYGLTSREVPFGDYSDGRWGWIMPLVLKLPVPIPHRGQQGIGRWAVPAEVAAQLQAGL